MKPLIHTLLLSLSFFYLGASPALAGLIMLEDAYEVNEFQVSLDDNMIGTITFSQCDSCPTLQLKITDSSKVYVNNALKQTNYLINATNDPAVILYTPGTDLVTRVLFFN